MKYDVVGLLEHAARQLNRKDGGTAFAVAELANNLRLLMRKEASVDDFLGAYTGHEGDALDLNVVCPVPKDRTR